MEKLDRVDILDKAKVCVNGERDRDYGSPERSFEMISNLWNIYLNMDPDNAIEARDVAAMLALLKIARISNGVYKADNWIDLAGYAACGGEIESSTEAMIKQASGPTEAAHKELLGKQ